MVTRPGGFGCAEKRNLSAIAWVRRAPRFCPAHTRRRYCAEMELETPTLLVSVAWTVPMSVATSLTVKTCV